MTNEQIEQIIKLNKDMFEFMLSKSNERGYASPESCVSYARSSVEQWADEAIVFTEWRDNVYLIINNIRNEAQQNEQVPKFEDIIGQLPELIWPEIK